MSDTNGSTRDGKRLAVYAINEKDGDRGTWWQKIGMAFTNRDGSIAIYLDALPLGTNKLQVREARDEAKAPAGATNGASTARRTPAGEEVRP
jgi:hypothetical protein